MCYIYFNCVNLSIKLSGLPMTFKKEGDMLKLFQRLDIYLCKSRNILELSIDTLI